MKSANNPPGPPTRTVKLLFDFVSFDTKSRSFFTSSGMVSKSLNDPSERFTIMVMVFSEGDSNSSFASGKLNTEIMFLIGISLDNFIFSSNFFRICLSLSVNFCLFFV